MVKHDRSPSQDKATDKSATKRSKATNTDHNDNLRHPSIKVAQKIDESPPMETLEGLVEKFDPSKTSPRNVLHWFRSKDLRMQDNKGLAAASQKAREGKGHLVCMYLFTPADMEWHGTSPARVDFILETLRLLQKELADKNIPLAIVTAEERAQKVDKVLSFIKDNDISHIYANYEYEIDELRRDIKLCKNLPKDIQFSAFHDQTVVEPGLLTTGAGTPHKVFTGYYHSWCPTIAQDTSLVESAREPEANDKSALSDPKLKSHFSSSIPSIPSSKQFESNSDRDRIRKLWPAGHAAAASRLEDFLSKKSPKYAAHRTEPFADTTSRLSPYFAAGVISIRETLRTSADHNKTKNPYNFSEDGPCDAGLAGWIREIVFREFYRQMLVITPHTAMNLPQNLKFDNVNWDDNEEAWQRWCDGTTGVPFVDAGMRQLKAEAFMHNRLRMITASYLRLNLLIDYRKGERFFAENLIDWDLANNTQGWEPSYTFFNPVSQGERHDKEGKYIRKWVPELKDLEGKAIFEPHTRLGKKEFEKLGYPKPMVELAESKERALGQYKSDLAAAKV